MAAEIEEELDSLPVISDDQEATAICAEANKFSWDTLVDNDDNDDDDKVETITIDDM